MQFSHRRTLNAITTYSIRVEGSIIRNESSWKIIKFVTFGPISHIRARNMFVLNSAGVNIPT